MADAAANAENKDQKAEAPLKKSGGLDKISTREREALRVFALAADNHRNGRLDDALRGYGRALQLNPEIPDVYNNMGVALRAQGKLDAAVACYRRSLALRPNNPGVYSNMGNALRELGKLDMAVASHQQAVKLAPKSPEAIYNLGLVLRDLGHPEKALDCFQRAVDMRPKYVDAHWDRALTQLLLGNFEDGFEAYEWRWKFDRRQSRDYERPQWDGSEDKDSVILLHHEQGLGDMIQFARFVPMVKERVGTVIVECQPELTRLFSSIKGVDRVIMRGAPLPAFNAVAPLMSLPRILGTTLETLPAGTPYLSAPEVEEAKIPVVPGTKLKVGICWAGRATHRNDHNRSVPFTRFVDLMGLPGVSFYSLQKGKPAGQLSLHACEALVMELGSRFEDLSDCAGAVTQLDLVITVDTVAAHLAGALNVPVWNLIPFAPDWRWMTGRDDSPWYPSMRLFRQPKPGDWDSVFLSVRRELQELALARRASKAG